jgi:hypothetical protein
VTDNSAASYVRGTAWTLATPVNILSSKAAGWQPMRITLIAGGKTSEFQVYNLYVDPRMTR